MLRIQGLVQRGFLAGLIWILLVVGPVAGTAQTTGGSVTGVLVSAEGGEPVAGCVVEVAGLGLQTVTDEDGAFRLDGLPTGQHEVVMRGDGYESSTVTVGILFPGYVRDLGQLSLTALAVIDDDEASNDERVRNRRNVITYEMIQESSGPTALAIVEQYRKNWLRRHYIFRQGQMVELHAYVHLDGARYADHPDALVQFSRELIKEIRYMSGVDSRVRFGPDYGGGMIEVITK